MLSSHNNQILIVDDDPIMCDLLQALLSQEGLIITVAPSGEDALKVLRLNATFAIVLTDMQLPGLQGEALAHALRQAMPESMLLLGMSGSRPPERTEKLLDAFLLKPFDVQLLRHAIQLAHTRKSASNPSELWEEDRTIDHVSAPLDPKIFASLASMISSAQLRDLFSMALKDIEKRHKRIMEAALENDLSTAQREAHAVKGSCGMIGASELQFLAAAIEDGTTLNTSAIEEIPRACLRLQRMLDSQLHTV